MVGSPSFASSPFLVSPPSLTSDAASLISGAPSLASVASVPSAFGSSSSGTHASANAAASPRPSLHPGELASRCFARASSEAGGNKQYVGRRYSYTRESHVLSS